MKHIKIRAELIAPEYKTVKFQIIEQTHRGAEFGIPVARGGKFPTLGIELISYSYPETGIAYGWLAVRGTDVDSDNTELKCSLEDYSKIKQAIEAYNEYYKE